MNRAPPLSVATRSGSEAIEQSERLERASALNSGAVERFELQLRSQIVISKNRRGGRRYLPYVFTDQGVAMLSSVLNSERAVEINIEIMRAFVRLREMILSNKDLARKLDALEHKFESHDVHIRFLPQKCWTKRLQENLSRQDAKPARQEVYFISPNLSALAPLREIRFFSDLFFIPKFQISLARSLFEAIRQLMTPPEPKKRRIGFLVKEKAARYGKRQPAVISTFREFPKRRNVPLSLSSLEPLAGA